MSAISKAQAISARNVGGLVEALRGELTANQGNIPDELKSRKAWLVYRVTEIQASGKFDKIPVYPKSCLNRHGVQGSPPPASE